MDQATESATLSAPTQEPGTFAHAHAVAGAVVAHLSTESVPFALEIEEDFPSGWRVHLKFRDTRAAGLLAFAQLVDVPVTRAETSFGVHLDAIARVDGIEVRGSALVGVLQAARLQGLPVPTERMLESTETGPAPEEARTATVQPVPLGSSVLAQTPAITPVQPPVEEVGANDVARCMRCGCTDDQACHGGCYWVPNAQMVDLCSACATPEELQAMTYTAEVSDGGE